MTPSDRQLAQQISRTLERQAHQADPELDARLEAVLRHIPQQQSVLAGVGSSMQHSWTQHHNWWFAGLFALCAVIAVSVWQFSNVVSDDTTAVALHPNVDPDFVADMDLVSVVGEDQP